MFVAAVCHALQLIRQVFPSTGARLYGLPGVPRAAGLVRAISYVHLGAYGPLRLPSLKACIIIVSFFVSMVTWIFSIQPHYRENAEAGSPPLAIRSGMVAVSLFPFIFACAASSPWKSLPSLSSLVGSCLLLQSFLRRSLLQAAALDPPRLSKCPPSRFTRANYFVL